MLPRNHPPSLQGTSLLFRVLASAKFVDNSLSTSESGQIYRFYISQLTHIQRIMTILIISRQIQKKSLFRFPLPRDLGKNYREESVFISTSDYPLYQLGWGRNRPMWEKSRIGKS
jgi:hypothetical protein